LYITELAKIQILNTIISYHREHSCC